MASIAAYILSQNLGIPNVQPLVTFASPKPGDVNFMGGFQKVLTQTRYENYNDFVPLLPPDTEFIDLVVSVVSLIPVIGVKIAKLFESAENWDYVPVGSQLFIDSNFNVIPNEIRTRRFGTWLRNSVTTSGTRISRHSGSRTASCPATGTIREFAGRLSKLTSDFLLQLGFLRPRRSSSFRSSR